MYIFLKLCYIDPSTGSLVFQAILSSFLTVLLFFKKIKLYLLAIFTHKKADKENKKND